MLRTLSSAVLVASLAAVGSLPARAQAALPQWLPIQALDKAFNDAAADLSIAQSFQLRDCGNPGDTFICTYASSGGVGVVAWSKQSIGLVEKLAISIPPCSAAGDLASIAAILVHTLHPRRPVSTYSRAIVALANFTAFAGAGDHWLDGVSYQLVRREDGGLGLIVERQPTRPAQSRSDLRRRAALQQRFFIPDHACGAVVMTTPVDAHPPLRARAYAPDQKD